MDIIALETLENSILLKWADGQENIFPNIWLRDSCPSGFHESTGERTFDLLSIDLNPQIASADTSEGQLKIVWQDGHESGFDATWLFSHRPGQYWEDPAALKYEFWPQHSNETIVPRHKASDLLQSDTSLESWMQDTAKWGISIVCGLKDHTNAGVEIAQRAGFLRRTNFGKVFEVMSKPDPNNLAYTSHALPLHTDLANQEVPPGYQFLHCLANEAQGGGSVFADGFAIAKHIEQTEPEAYKLLSEVPIPFRFFDEEYDIRTHTPVIVLEPNGTLREIRYNAHLAGIFDMPAEKMADYYDAYRKFMALTRAPAFRVTLRLKAGEMVVFDNRRTLHGREAFDPSTGFRHLHGCYVDRAEFSSRLRLLAR